MAGTLVYWQMFMKEFVIYSMLEFPYTILGPNSWFASFFVISVVVFAEDVGY